MHVQYLPWPTPMAATMNVGMSTSETVDRPTINGNMKPLPSPPARLPAELAHPPDYTENGRKYHGWHRGAYMLPCDDVSTAGFAAAASARGGETRGPRLVDESSQELTERTQLEQERMDIYHRLFQVARKEPPDRLNDEDVLHIAPVSLKPDYDTSQFSPANTDAPEYEARVLDLGCGTGIWAIDMADKYSSSTVVGVDLSWIQPAMKPKNLSWRQQDFEYAWHTLGFDSWDLIHMRMLLGSVSDWTEMYHKVYLHLKPGIGWIEHTEIDFEPRCDDDTLPSSSALLRWYRDLVHATSEARKPIQYNDNVGNELRRLGFVDVKEEVIQIPLNPWRADKRGKELGQWFNLAITLGVHAMSLAPFCRVFNWPKEDVDQFTNEVKREMSNKRYHVYCNMHTWVGRKPERPQSPPGDPEELPDA